MRLILLILLFISCSQIEIKNQEREQVVTEDVVFEPVIEDHEVFNGKTKFISMPFEAASGARTLTCTNNKNNKVTRYDAMIENNILFAYITESYFSRKQVKKCLVDGVHVLNLSVKEFPYKRERLNVAKGKVDLSKKDLARVIKEKKIKREIYKKSAKTYLFTEAFEVPLNSYITSYYGNVRLFNNKKRSQHLGNDLRAAVGVPIPASNRGRVVYVGNLFFSGNVVVIDHGLNIFTVYAHLSKFNVTVGDIVNKRDIIGLAGKTGRVSGPHLHWGVKVAGNNIDGFSLVSESKKHFENENVDE